MTRECFFDRLEVFDKLFRKNGDDIYMDVNFVPSSFMKIAKLIEGEAYEAYFVGGAVRDVILGRELHDFDLTVSARPEELKKILKDYRIIDTGIKHGTVTVLTEDGSLEITTFRQDVISSNANHRHPTAVIFGKSLEEDLARRDFTINALALSPAGRLIDLYDGLGDINRRLIRAVGEAGERLEEDALRILRALRFAACLSFNIEDSLKKAINEKKNLLKFLSVERIDSELSRLVNGEMAAKYICEYGEIFFEILDGVSYFKYIEFWTKLAKLIDSEIEGELAACDILAQVESDDKCYQGLKEAKKQENYEYYSSDSDVARLCLSKILSSTESDEIRYALFFSLLAIANLLNPNEKIGKRDKSDSIIEDVNLDDFGKSEISKKAYDLSMSLHGPKLRADRGYILCSYILANFPTDLYTLKKLYPEISKLGIEFKDLLKIKKGLAEISNVIRKNRQVKEKSSNLDFIMESRKFFVRLENLLDDFELAKNKGEVFTRKDLKLSTEEIIKVFGIKGRVIGILQNYLLDLCLKDASNNDREKLLAFAKDYLNEKCK